MFKRGKWKKGMKRGSVKPYRYSHVGVTPCPNMRCRSPHGVSEPAVAAHGAHCSNHEHHSSGIEDVEPKRHFGLHTRAAALKTHWQCSA
jgi:hypothetical protein